MTTPSASAGPDPIEVRIARVLSVGALLAVVLLLAGIVLMVVRGVAPDAPDYPPFDPGSIVPDMLALRPSGFLWAGIVVVIVTPVIRVIGELVGFALRRERGLALVAAAILLVVGSSVLAALVAGG